jgi:hypothetical protein
MIRPATKIGIPVTETSADVASSSPGYRGLIGSPQLAVKSLPVCSTFTVLRQCRSSSVNVKLSGL